jgi:hypothetical protein
MKSGIEYRLIHFANFARNNVSGTFSFDQNWTSSNPQVTDPAGGNSIASFLLGYMSSASATLNATPYLTWKYPVLFYHDDWQMNRRLTLNLGLRWDYESPVAECFNRQNRGFDPTVKRTIQVLGLDLKGGLLFAGVSGQPRGAFDPDWNNVQPRFGLAYRVLSSKPLVLRGSFGRYFLPTASNGGTIGFSQTTSSVTSTADFLPYQTLSNPFPNGLIQPPGSSLGLATQVGDSISFSDPTRAVPKIWQYSAGFEYALLPGLLVDASYGGSQTKQLGVSNSLSFLTPSQLAMGTAYLSTVVSNPFYGVLLVTRSRGAQPTIQRRNLIVQYPQYSGFTISNISIGENWYNALQLKLQKRFSHAFSVLVSYTNSKTMEVVSYLNPQDTKLDRELASFDVSQRLMVSGLFEFPVGPNKRWFSHGLASRIVGSWQVSWNSVKQSGPPMTYPNYYLNGNPKLTSGQSLNHWFDTSPQIWVQPPPDTLRVTPLRSSNIRRHTAPQFDVTLIRDFQIKEGHKLQFKVSSFNITNTPILNFPNTTPTSTLFGVVRITQINLPRSVELGFRYAF